MVSLVVPPYISTFGKHQVVTHFFALAPIFARLKNEKCLERAENLTETLATQARNNWDDCLSIAGTIPQLFIRQHPFIHLGGEKQCGASSCLSHGTTNRRKQTLITDILWQRYA